MSPVPGGRSSSSTSRSPQYTSARNCCSARCSIGPRHTTGALPGVNMPIEMTFTPCADGGMIMFSTWVGRAVDAQHARHRVAVDVGVDHADLEAVGRHRRGQVDRHRRLADAALAGRDRVDAGERARLGEGDLALGLAAAQRGRQLLALLVAHHVERRRRRAVTPSTARDRVGDAVGDRRRASGSRRPSGTRSTATAPSAPISTDLTMPSSVIGRWISGSFTVASASRTASSRSHTDDGTVPYAAALRQAVTGRLRHVPRPSDRSAAVGAEARRAAAPPAPSIRSWSSERIQSRVATSPSAIRSAAISRVRYSVSAIDRSFCVAVLLVG